MENACISIQRYWRLSRLKRALSILKFNKYITNKHTFEQFTEKIQKQIVLDLVYYILNKTRNVADYKNKQKCTWITPQEFLSAFVINGYGKDVINNSESSTNLQTLESEVGKLASEIIEMFDSFLYQKLNYELISKFYKLLNKFKITFTAWKSGDHKQIIHILTLSFHDIENTINIITRERDLEELSDDEKQIIELSREQQNSIKEKINSLNGQEYFENYKLPEITLDASVENHIREILHNAYWDILKKELNEEPPKFDQLVRILVEVRDTFCSLVPRRADIHREIYESIDVDFIKDMAKNNAIDGTTLYNLATYIIGLIKKFQPREMDADMENWEKDINTQFTNGFTYDEFLITFFKTVFSKLEAIKKATEEFRGTELYTRMVELYEERSRGNRND